ncbi:MAG TPA: (2Fe-2S)-binding protein [Fimbriimonadaceae bacterium]|nr:(2Fe-2S)-binding protein [Fimbriimonadaceae bacterium]
MPEYTITVNGQQRKFSAEPDMPLLWALRDLLDLPGTKYGCGVGGCGACTVLLDGKEARSCLTTVAEVGKAKVTTIEGVSPDGSHPVQKAWVEHDVPQCGYCQPGKIMTVVALLAGNKNPTDKDIDDALGPHVCRCGTYERMRQAIKAAARGAK